ncbi:hypothetical protein BDC45DRAFT_568705 [Circinella umbellata]|nr:hypothetical protein BDC45DRAFT_568705 [Circinella umbellata]
MTHHASRGNLVLQGYKLEFQLVRVRPQHQEESVIFDISLCSGIIDDHIDTLMKAYPINNGILTQRGGARVLAKINLKNEEKRIHALNTGIDFTCNITIRATRALHKKATINKLRLTEQHYIPLLINEEITQDLHATFQKYGTILDIRINHHPKTKAYMGNGFAVLNIHAKADQCFEKLSLYISWCGDEDDLIYAHFEGMLLHCSWCHQLDHFYEDYIDTKERNTSEWSPDGNKKSSRKISNTKKTALPSQEIQKSIHAPQKGQKKSLPLTPTNQFSVLEDSEDDSESDDTPEIKKRGYLEETLDYIVFDFANYKVNHIMIPSEEEEHALNRNLPKDWITTMELSDAAKEIILDPELPSTLKMVLYNRLIYQRLTSIKEYDETLFAAASLSDAK